jgi:DNA-binding transcriptional MerR regulator
VTESILSAEELAREINEWCQQHHVHPASGQAGERLTERNVRYYRTLGLLDSPTAGEGRGYGQKHRLQLIALRLLQAQGLPLNRIRELLFGRSLQELQRIEKQGLAELERSPALPPFHSPARDETWTVTPLDDEFMIISRRGRRVPENVCERLRTVLQLKDRKEQRTEERSNGVQKEN